MPEPTYEPLPPQLLADTPTAGGRLVVLFVPNDVRGFERDLARTTPDRHALAVAAGHRSMPAR